MKKKYLLAPGPTPVPEHISLEMALPMQHHRTPQFSKIFGEAAEGAKYLFQTKQDVLILASTGTGAMEGCVTNLFSSGDKVLVINGGKFGERWGKISETFGLNVVWHNVEWGKAADPNEIKSILAQDKEIKAIREGVDGGNYFPHYLLETFIKIENILDKPLKELESNADENLSNMEAIFSKARQNLGTPSAAHLRRTEPYENFMSNPLGVIRKYSMDAIAFNRVNYVRNILYKGLKHLPRGEFEQTKVIRDYVNDIFINKFS